MTTKINFNFKRNKEPDMCYNPEKADFTYYQICQFPNPNSGLYGVRRLKLNEYFEIVSQKEKEYPKKKVLKFTEKIPVNKFMTYPTYFINLVALPNPDQLIGANSELLK